MKTPGGYQIRAAVQDARSKAVGSSAQFVEVPKVGKGEIALSGVVMMDVASATTSGAVATQGLSDGVLGEPAVKIFKPGSEVAYTCEVYDGRGSAPGVATTATLFRDGQPIFTSPSAPMGRTGTGGDAVRAVPVGGRLTLGRQLLPGSYTLRVSVARADSPARAHASQWAEFEVR